MSSFKFLIIRVAFWLLRLRSAGKKQAFQGSGVKAPSFRSGLKQSFTPLRNWLAPALPIPATDKLEVQFFLLFRLSRIYQDYAVFCQIYPAGRTVNLLNFFISLNCLFKIALSFVHTPKTKIRMINKIKII